MIRARVPGLVAATVLLLAACGDEAETGRRDPLSSSFDLLNRAEPIYGSAVEGLAPNPERPWRFGLYLGESCLAAGVDEAYSSCIDPRPSEGTTMYDGGVHDDVSLAWLVTGDPDVNSARFWRLDGTTIDQAPIPVDGSSDPPIVFGVAVAATNEIVGVELLDGDGQVLAALSIDGAD